MKLFVLLMLSSAFCGCGLTPNVNTRKPGQKWYYFGDLSSLYHDESPGRPVPLVWLDDVQVTRVAAGEFQKTVRALLTQGYQKIGFISVRSQYFVDPFEAKKLAADKGARMVVGCWFSASSAGAKSNTVEYWYQLLDRPGPPGSSVTGAFSVATPTPTPVLMRRRR
jgi:hypothetical protein